jgi:hypothetical protein
MFRKPTAILQIMDPKAAHECTSEKIDLLERKDLSRISKCFKEASRNLEKIIPVLSKTLEGMPPDTFRGSVLYGQFKLSKTEQGLEHKYHQPL